ncbi:MAG: M56 family metallopeptidase [Alphaproteobacteria bacterium]
MSLPPIPAAIWGGGMMLLLASAAWRINRSLRLLREGVAAPPSVARTVADAAGELGLARPPAVLMVDRRISPMLWCGRRACLVLPRRLWDQLDEVGRSAVIYHELAHLRRRDHWVCWAQMIIGWIYWWHPGVWWIRRRLREEADCCCDVWVTSLLPRGRRAYAQALLETRKYTSVIGFNRPAVPSVGLGVSTVRAKRFARRLTMVMTAQMSPRMSARGIALAVGLALGGYMAAPIWACPPAKDKDTAYKAYKSDKRLKIVVPAKPIRPPAPWRPVTTVPEDGTTTFERFMRDRDRPDRDDMSLEQRIEELERQIERLERHIERLLDNPRRRGVLAPGVTGIPGKSLGVTVPPMPPLAPMPPMPPMPAMAPMPAVMGGGGGGGPFVSVGGGSGGFLCACLRGDSACGCKVVVRSYEVSSGKLEALSELMLRRDVPIRVRPTPDAIEVHATGPQHCVFEIFCMMIDGEDRVKSFQLPKGKLEALTDLMARQDVPIFIEPGGEKITVYGTDLEQAVFGAFVNLIGSGAQEAQSPAADAYAAPALVERARQYEARAGLAMAEARHMKAWLRSLATQIRSFERQAERVMGRAEALADKAEALEYEAEEFEDAAENLEGARRITMIARANALLAQAEGLQQQARSLEVQGEAIEDQAKSLEDEAEEIEDRIEDLEEQAEEESD